MLYKFNYSLATSNLVQYKHEQPLQFFHQLIFLASLGSFLSGVSARFIMAYIPPHKRHSKETERPLPTPELLAPQFKKKLDLRSSKSNADLDGKVIYANHARSRWCLIGLDDENQFPSSVNLEPISWETTERRIGEKPLALINASLDKG